MIKNISEEEKNKKMCRVYFNREENEENSFSAK